MDPTPSEAIDELHRRLKELRAENERLHDQQKAIIDAALHVIWDTSPATMQRLKDAINNVE